MLQVKRNANDPFSVQAKLTGKKKSKNFCQLPSQGGGCSCGRTGITNNKKKKTKNKIHTHKSRRGKKERRKEKHVEKQENVEEKSKRLNFNAAISLAWRGRVRITV